MFSLLPSEFVTAPVISLPELSATAPSNARVVPLIAVPGIYLTSTNKSKFAEPAAYGARIWLLRVRGEKVRDKP